MLHTVYVTVTFISGLNSWKSYTQHISSILWGSNRKFRVWMHLDLEDCSVLFGGHLDLDLWLSCIKNREQGIHTWTSMLYDLPNELWHFDRISAYFSDASQNFPMHKISPVSFWIGRLVYLEQIKVIIRQADPYDKTGNATKGGRACKFDFTKTFWNQLFSGVRVLHHHYSITNHSESILKSKIWAF